MEKTHSQSQTKLETLQRYHQLTSPITPYSTVKNQETVKEQLKRNVSLRLDCIKQRNSKIYAIDTNTSISQLKASAILYQIPEFSAPEVNFQVAEQIKKKVDQVKNEVITHLPQISKSSNYAPRKLEHQISHRSAVKQLEQWLKTKLKQPPTVIQDTIEYKNMIMGVGMKELIRLISRRCNQEGRIAEQIWQLTWGICRQIILYLSKRARKCELILQEQLEMMRMASQREFQRLKQENLNLKNKVIQLTGQNRQINIDLQKIKKRTQVMQQENKKLFFDNYHLQQDFKNLLEENLAIYLQIGDKNKRGWIKKMYKNISRIATPQKSSLTHFYRHNITGTIQNRIKQERVTQEPIQEISKAQIQQIGELVIEQVLRNKKNRVAKHKKQRNSKQSLKSVNKQEKNQINQNETQFITQPYEYEHLQEQIDEASCKHIVQNLRQQFKPIDTFVQTENPVLIHAYAGTKVVELNEIGFNVASYMIDILPQMGVNTEDLKEQTKNSKKKDKQKQKGKQNSSEQLKRHKSKIMQVIPISKQKLKPKNEKDRTNTLQTVQEESKDVLVYKDDIQLGNRISYAQEESRLSMMSNSDFDNLLVKEPENDRNSFKINPIQKKTQSKLDIATTQSKLETKEINQIPKIAKTQSKQIYFKIFEKEHQNKQASLTKLPYKNLKSSVQKQNISLQTVYNQQVSNQSEKKQDNLIRNAFESTDKKEQSKQDNLTLIQKQQITFICSQCKKLINLTQQKAQSQRLRQSQKKPSYSPIRNSKHFEKQMKKSNALTPSPCSSVKKLALKPIESCREEQYQDHFHNNQPKFQGRRNQRQYTKNNSGYLHDVAYKKQLEQITKNQHVKRQQTQVKVQSNEQRFLIFSKTEPHKFFISQIMDANKQFISAMSNSIGQTSDSSQQYLQLVKQINSMTENKINMTEKGALSIIEKNVFPILNQLLVIVRKAVKTNKIPEAMKLFTSLPSIVFNRINRKYGVKILASKHLKVILMAIKSVGRFTDKLKTIQLMMFTDCKSLQSEDFFIYLLIMDLFDPSYSATRVLNNEESYTIRCICEQHLTKQSQVYNEFQRLVQTKGESVLLGDVVKSIITNYRLLKINRIQELGFIFLMLKRDQNWMNYKDFITFMSTFTFDNTLRINITKKLLQFCDVKNRDNTLGITENMFTKFLTSCEILNLSLLQSNVNDQIEHYSAKDNQILPEIIEKLYETVFKVKSSYYLLNNVAEQESIPSAGKFEDISSVLQTGQISQSQTLQNESQQSIRPGIQNIKVVQKLRTYSNFTYKICNYLQKDQQIKFLTPRQNKFIKMYLVLHILNCQVQKLVGIVDYFSNSMLGLMFTPLQQFSLNSKPSVNV